MKKQLYKLLFILSFSTAVGQVGINTTAPEAQLDIRSSNQATPSNTDGILIPKIDAFPITNPTAAQNGMMVFLTTTVGIKPPGFYYWDSITSTWIGLAAPTSGWALTGNSGTTNGTNFIGTTDNQGLDFRTNNIIRGRFTSAGFLGIGTTAPNQQLELTGNFRLPTSTATAGIIYSGNNRFVHNFGGTFIGLNAGNLAATATVNVGVGQNVLQNQTTGNFNVGVGVNALSTSTSGFSNTAIGYQSMQNATTAGDNTALGSSALKSLTTGARNIAVGSQAMGGNVSGSDNVGVGYGALSGALTGGFNTAVGNSALVNNTSGVNNAAFGREAMQSNTTGGRNTAIGYGALYSNAIGGSNTVLGHDAGHDATGSGNVLLGYQSGYSETGNNKLYIDNSNTASPLVYGDFSTNLLRVNGTLNINNAYSFPTTDGTAGQVLTTNGAGAVAWGAAAPAETDPNAWHLNGNTGTVNGTNFIGTTDNQAIDFRTNNIIKTRFTTKGQIEPVNTGGSVLIGEGAGVNDDLSANYNAFIGFTAGTTNTTGEFNTAIGTNGLRSNTTGASNSATGAEALYNNITGNGNTAVGRASLNLNYTGSNNTAIGYNSDVTSGGLNNATAIGYSAKVAASNSMVLGGTGANAVKVGIGTTTPAKELEVVGEVRTSSLAGAGTKIVQADTNGTLSPMIAGTASQVLLGTGVWGSVPEIAWSLMGNSGTVNGTNFIGTTDNQAIDFRTNNIIKTRFTTKGQIEPVNTGGSVLIGEGAGLNDDLSANYNAFIGFTAGTTNTTGEFNTAIGTNGLRSNTTGASNSATGAEALYNNITGNGNTAVGRASLNLNYTGSNNTAIGYNSDVTSGGLNNATAIGYSAKVAASNSMVLGGTGANAVKVGIGTTTPAKELEVVGEVRTSSLAGTGTRVVQADSNGTLTPLTAGTASQVLLGTGVWGTVPGLTNDWSITGNTGTVAGTNFIGTTDNQAIDFRTNNIIKTRFTTKGQIETLNTGNSVFVGENAGANDDLSDNRNVLIGLNAGQTSTTSNFNTGIGYQALQNSVSNGATAVGYNALQNYIGIRGTAVGYEALKLTTTGSSNTAVGYAALSRNTTGGNNTAVGSETLLNVTTGNSNVGVGKYALLNTTTSAQNTGVGVSALFSNSTGTNNTALGFQSLGNNTSGNNNLAIGINTLASNTTGSNNIAVGYGADVLSSALSNAIAIGLNAKVNASNSMVLGGTGVDAVKVGIGTTTPAKELEVVGEVRTSSLAGTGTRVVQADSNGTLTPLAAGTASQVLLGTGVWGSVPGITNDWSITGNAGTVNGTNFIGTTDNQAIDFRTNNTIKTRFTTKGQIETLNTGQSVFVGEGAGANDDLSNNINAFVGYQSGNTNTTGTENAALGYRTLQLTTTGSYNTAMGSNAMRSNTTGFDNVGAGNSALNANTTGTNNTGVGAHALNSNTTGISNTAIGRIAMNNNTTANNNTAVGARSLESTTTGSSNTAIGYRAAGTNITGYDVTAQGYNSLLNNTTGFGNTAIGTNALSVNTTGNKNTALGYNADVTTAALTNATAVGYNAKVGASNSMVLGGIGIDAVKVGIGTTTPAKELEVVGEVSTSSLAGTGTRMVQADTNGTLTPLAAGTASQVLLGTGVWGTVPGLTNDWSTTGNSGTVSGTNFIGTTDNQALDLRTNNVVRTRFTTKGQIETLNTGNSVFIGANAGANDDLTTNQNTFIGYNSGFTNSTGENNTAIGASTLYSNTLGINNTAVGYNSLLSNTSGNYNATYGDGSGYNNTIGSKNAFMGYFGGFSNTSGSGNTAIGQSSLYNNMIGSNNTALGNGADVTSSALTNATAIGYNAKVAASNSLVLGGTGADLVKVGIGTTTPSAYVDVYGTNTGTTSALLRSGNNNNASISTQIAFGYSGTNTYMHSIKTRHLSTADTNNAIDFTVWDYGTDAVGTIGTKTVMTIDGEGTGRVGVGTMYPLAPLEVNGSAMLSSATANSDLQFNTLTRSTIYPNGANTPANLAIQLRSKGNGVLELNSDNVGNVQMVTGGGNVGIGTATPTQAKVVINGTQNATMAYGYLNNGGTTGTSGSSTNAYSLYASGRIAATEFNAFSDERIKNIKGISNSRKDLETLNKIQITDYTFKDSIGKGLGTNKKVIAQQVEKVYPQAVSTITDVIPDIYTLAKIKDGRIILKNTLQKGDRVKLVFDNRTELVTVLQADEYGFNVSVKDEGKVFVFGREVKDFHTVDYEALSTLNISATQELVKIINQQEEQIRGLKADNSDINKRLSQTEADINQIKSMFNSTVSSNSK